MFKATNWEYIKDRLYGETYATAEDMIVGMYEKMRSIHKMSKILGVSSHTLHQKMKAMGITLNRPGRPDWAKSPQWRRLEQELDDTHRNEPISDMSRRLGINRNTISEYRKRLFTTTS